MTLTIRFDAKRNMTVMERVERSGIDANILMHDSKYSLIERMFARPGCVDAVQMVQLEHVK
jgi:hypothetical protein